MRAWQLIFGIFLFLLFDGCASSSDTGDLSKIKESSERSAIEALLGPPIESHTIRGATFYVYKYELDKPIDRPPRVADPMAQYGIVILWGIDRFFFRDKEKGYFAATYTDDNRLENYGKSQEKNQLLKQFRSTIVAGKIEKDAIFAKDFLRSCKKSVLIPEDRCGEVIDALYMKALRMGRKEGWRLHCLAAHFGHSKAQNVIGNYYRGGLAPVKKDLKMAFVWYSLAEESAAYLSKDSWIRAAVKKNRKISEKGLALSQVTEAKRLLAEWRSNLEECEIKGAQNAS